MRNTSLPLLLMTLSLAPFASQANDIEPGKEFYTVIKAPNPIVLDGSLSEWSGVPVLADPKFATPKGTGSAGNYVLFEEYQGGTWTGPDDQTSAVQVTYDVDNVYFGFVVTDDYHENAANSAWNGDSIQLMIASADRTAQVALYNYALGGVEGALLNTITNHEAGPGGTEAVVTRNATTKRTTYEIKLPKASLGLVDLATGTRFGLGMAINDGDQATPGQKGWGGLGAHALVFGKSPSETALMTLAAPLPPSNDIEPGKETYSVSYAPKPIILDGSLAEWAGVPVLADPKFSTPKGSGPGGTGTYVLFEEYQGGTWTGPDDQTSAVQVTYDVDNVYFGFVVTDDYHENAANSAWNGDSIQLMIASADRTAQVALYNYALGGVEGALLNTITNHEAGPGGTEAVVTRNATTKRTTYEIKLPKASLGLTELTGGTQFGLGMAINDGDQATPGQKGWGGLGAHALVFGKSPSETALMTLRSYNDIELGKDTYTATAAPNGIAVDGSLSEWVGVPVLADPKFSTPKGSGATGSGTYVLFEEYQGGTWTGPDDQTSAVQIVYDAQNVYFGFVVTDDYHENAANSAWNGDSIQLMIANADRTAQVALYNYALGGVEGTLLNTITNHEAGPGGTIAIVSRDSLNKKTTYEIKLPVASLGLSAPLAVGTQFGLGMAINDGDEATPGQKGWGGLGAHALVFGKSPGETALITLGSGGSGSALFFLSAINPAVDKFSFRANDLGTSIVDPATAKLRIDGQLVSLVASPKVLDATDFTYRPAPPFAPGSHTYALEIKDTEGNIVTDSGSFVTPTFTTLTPAHQAVSVDTTKPGFIWRVFQNQAATPLGLAQAELALVGQLQDEFGVPFDNLADPAAIGVAAGAGTVEGALSTSLVRFEIPTVINLSQTGGEANGNFGDDGQMPGVPGIFGGGLDGIDAEILTFVELPVGLVTLGVTSDDGFRVNGGFINDPANRILLGESEIAATTTFTFLVQYAGVYPLRAIWQDSIEAAHVEWFSVKSDGTRVLLNDIANGGLKTYRVGVAPTSGASTVSISLVGGQKRISWTEPGVVLQESTDLINWTDLTTATSPYTVTGTRSGVFFRLKK